MMDLVEMAKRHRAADILMAGTFGKGEGNEWRGCSVGCFAHEFGGDDSDDIHAFVADKLGVPEWAIRLQDRMFEGLRTPDRYDWHVQVAEAYEKVSDWPLALHRVHAAILTEAIKAAGESHDVVKAVLDLHAAAARGEDVSENLWSAAESAARIAAWSAAESATESAAWSAAESAAWSAAESAARSASWSVSWNAAWSAAYRTLRDSILAAMPTPQDSQ